MIINPTTSLRETEANQSPAEKRLKTSDVAVPVPLTGPTVPDDEISPQAQLVQHMIDAWQSKDGTVSGKILKEVDTEAKTDADEAVVTTAGSMNSDKSASVGNTSGSASIAVQQESRVSGSQASQLDNFRAPTASVQASGVGGGQQSTPSVFMDMLGQPAPQASIATRDIVSPPQQQSVALPQPPVVDKSPIPVHIPELEGVVSDTFFEFDALPSLVEGRFEALAA